jgi:murein DD-endopeptidase MepM/ murein hydrolase activator NlpD
LRKRTLILTIIIAITIGLIVPQSFIIPVEKANKSSYNTKSFWYYPWGKSGTHKGVDIFAKEGTNVKSSTHGLVLYTGEIAMGGKVILILGPKWRMHYYAHLKDIRTTSFSLAKKNEVIGTVGTTGNAKGKSPHLHYAITTLIPYPWRYDNDRQGWKKMFYLNPIEYM